jgi:hypothetical protein
MSIGKRARPALQAAGVHLAISAAIAAASAALVFWLWYPWPYAVLAGGKELFVLLVTVDVVIGPALTLAVYDRSKLRSVLWRDLSSIALMQMAALAYGLYSVHAARPVYLAFEGNRFRVVSASELDPATLKEARYGFDRLPQSGPVTIGVRLAQPEDADYLQSVRLSMEGLHPSLRPSRWQPYDAHRAEVVAVSKPLGELRQRKVDPLARIEEAVTRARLPAPDLAYLPLQSRTHSDWVVLVDRRSADVRALANVDGW